MHQDFVLPDGWSKDEGALFGDRGNGFKYGWNCTTLVDRGNFRVFQVENPSITNTAARYLHKSCHPFFNNPDRSAPYKYPWRNRSIWQIEVPNGVYNVKTTHSRDGKNYVDLHGCMIEHQRLTTDSQEYPDGTVMNTEVEVLDGYLTVEGIYKESTGDQFDCYGLSLIEIEKVYDRYPNSFMVGSQDPYWQLELKKTEDIGLVSVSLPRGNDCHYWWAWRGSKCPDTRPWGWFDSDLSNTGFIVGVSDRPDRKGTECARKWYAGGSSTSTNTVHIDCKGATGKYVYIKLPGKDRALHINSVVVHKALPESDPDDYVCYGVIPREQTETAPEFMVVQDPDDPIFYSTCYVREKRVKWVGLEITPQIPPWHYNGKCIGCDSYERNLNTGDDKLHTLRWNITKNCVNCHLEKYPSEKPDPMKWVRSYNNTSCQDGKNDCSENNCIKSLYLIGRGRDNDIMDEEECQWAASRDSECSNHVIWHESRKDCFCYRKKSCCRGSCTYRSYTGRTLFELVSEPPLKVCDSPYVKSADGKMCCPATCSVDGTNYCGVDGRNCYDKVKSGLCCKTSLVKSCINHGPPCLMS